MTSVSRSRFVTFYVLLAAIGIAVVAPGNTVSAGGTAPVVLDALSRHVPLDIKAHWNSKSQWVPLFNIGVAFDAFEEDDILVVQHYKGHGKKAKAWGKPQKCAEHNEDDRLTRQIGQRVWFFNCKGGDELLIGTDGAYSAKITYRQTGAGTDHRDLKTIEYTVKKYYADASGSKKQLAFVATLDHRIGEGWLSYHGDGKKDGQEVRLSTWFKWDTHGELRDVKMRCFHNDKKFGDFDSHNRYDVETASYVNKSGDPIRESWGKYVFHVKPNFGKGMVHWDHPKEGSPNPEVFYLSKNPGDYRCTVTFEGDLVREIKFKIADGKVVEPGCAGTQVRAGAQHHMVSVNVKAGPMKYDNKAFEKAGWFGIGASACK